MPSAEVGYQGSGKAEGKGFLSLFGGVAHPAQAWVREGGWAAVVDLDHSPQNDLSCPNKWNQINAALHLFECVGIDLPCDTWFWARRAFAPSKFPQPLRGDDPNSILGLANLKPPDQEKVRKANLMMFSACKTIRRALKLGICGYLENPLSSRLWPCRPIRKLLEDRRVQTVKRDMCQYGTQWKKATRLLVWNAAPFSMLQCSGRGVCSRTKKPHVRLAGISGNVFFLSSHKKIPNSTGMHLFSLCSPALPLPFKSHCLCMGFGECQSGDSLEITRGISFHL